ncbi:hypothetical protein [Parapedobacter tibetensis]|uniref:hypothetical protein n=1 Tax=Parapedobacter tibetensis TaxID=2972951 RepID=UPI00214D4EA8|nr:hypothetical protein [Parapedobacter tibetensis]
MKDKHTYRHLDESGRLPDALQMNPYTVPADYFEDLHVCILQRCRHIEDSQASFMVPSGYFDELRDNITTKIAEQRLKEIVDEPGFSVPEGYFVGLERNLSERCRHIGNGSLLSMPVPPGYFQQLQEDILIEVSAQKLKEKVNEPGFIVPADYFDNLQHAITKRTSQGELTPIRKISRPKWMAYAAAACVALAVSIVGFLRFADSEQSISTNHLTAVSDQEILNYLEFYGTTSDFTYISEHLDDFGGRNIGEGLSEEDIEAYLNNTL